MNFETMLLVLAGFCLGILVAYGIGSHLEIKQQEKTLAKRQKDLIDIERKHLIDDIETIRKQTLFNDSYHRKNRELLLRLCKKLKVNVDE